MSIPQPTVTAFLDLPADGGDFFTLDDPVKGVLDSVYTLAGDVGTDLSGYAFDISVTRGRASELDTTGPGTAYVTCRNHNRTLDPLNTASAFFGLLRLGRRAEISIYGQTIYSGVIDDCQVDYRADEETTAAFPLTDALGQLARREFDEWTATEGQLPGARLNAILDRTEVAWPGGARDINTGVATLQGDLVTWGSNVLNYAQLVALSDLGHLFASRRNVVTFRDRVSLTNTTPLLTFKADGTGVRFHGARLTSGAERYFNRVGIDREHGTLQTAVDTAAGDEDGIRALSRRGLLMDSDGQSESMAEWLLSIYSEPVQRVSSITVNVSGLTSDLQPAVAALELNDVVGIEWTPLGVGSAIVDSMSVEGIRHTIPVGGPHVMQVSLAPITQTTVFVLDDPVLGLLDGIGLLAY
jgi:hypothetical protein